MEPARKSRRFPRSWFASANLSSPDLRLTSNGGPFPVGILEIDKNTDYQRLSHCRNRCAALSRLLSLCPPTRDVFDCDVTDYVTLR